MKTITVFTPTYNRAFCLGNLYESLVRQTSQDFKWLIIDDGSSDNTNNLVNTWIVENKIDIQYQYQENQGMHGGHNTAYSLINTELNVCIDSDDFLPNNAVELILDFWNENGSNKYAGIVGLDGNKGGEIIGTPFPTNIKESSLIDLYEKHKVTGDKKLVLRTEIVKKYPIYPLFKGERFVPLGYKYLLIDQDYTLLTLNEILCIVEYLPDGSSLNILKQYKKNPKGFAFSRLAEMQYGPTFLFRFKKAIHYVCSSIMAKNSNFIKESPKKILTVTAIPFGLLLYTYIYIKTYE
ncbi:glycosyl transferase family 2 [Mariniflexile fucanivorans]|uniref:Glycosyl transferase family 2 n=1 Tax=Mariniflexile fucanivorans TaxID=264023 RepID=A0A4V2QDN3_9FLAO|nr:glycosyltransferase family A protein [Mariniflexile fucanivorans]TCL65017.1 glycosyl transferase family 2 [Mariniflexile fucanivorans]